MPVPFPGYGQTPQTEQTRSESRAESIDQRAAHVDLPSAARRVLHLAVLVFRARQRLPTARARQRLGEEHLLRAHRVHSLRIRGDEPRIPASRAPLVPPSRRPRARRLVMSLIVSFSIKYQCPLIIATCFFLYLP